MKCLFLPENWIKDKAKCKLADIPQEHIKFKTKPQLALKMVNEGDKPNLDKPEPKRKMKQRYLPQVTQNSADFYLRLSA